MAVGYSTTIARLERCGADVVLGAIERPEGYSFRAGQWFRLTMRTSKGEETRTFSHSAAPHDPAIEFATRLSPSSFKQALAELRAGDTVQVSPPGGRLALPEEDVPLAILAGGVGITPIRSLLRDARERGRSFSDAVLLYGNRDDSCIAYREDVEAMGTIGVEVVHVLEAPPEGWEQESGFITIDLIRRHALGSRTFVVSGPPAMVVAMERLMDEVGVPADKRIIESFGPRTTPVEVT